MKHKVRGKIYISKWVFPAHIRYKFSNVPPILNDDWINILSPE